MIALSGEGRLESIFTHMHFLKKSAQKTVSIKKVRKKQFPRKSAQIIYLY